jgi:hypothetical protein
MAQGKYLVRGEGNTLPPGAALPELFNRLLPVEAILGGSGNQVGNSLAMPSYGDGFSVLDHSEEFG